jgi:CheY-specific phosphatase CheX
VSDLDQIVDRITEEVLERMFFSTVLGPAPEGDPVEGLRARVEFSGSFAGALGVSIDRAAAMEHTVNFLGASEGELPFEDVGAVVGELANVLCGATLARISPDGTFLISTPQVQSSDIPSIAAGAVAVRRSFELPEGCLTVELSLNAEEQRVPCPPPVF